MKCCGTNNNDNNNNNQGEGKKHNPMKHMLMMVLCCGLPYLIVAVLPFISLGAGFKLGLAAIAPFICPIMMGFMMFTMFRGKKKESCCDDKKKAEEVIKLDK